ncbi:hypothetical protein [Deinococcus fonticola]|uniref:hypothetical protein n=1 Tax=Deinococcus fonticola TaxID=2528713 RepID=UPI00107587D3|nr:hypothetical protein [Deinococcus fonticola]
MTPVLSLLATLSVLPSSDVSALELSVPDVTSPAVAVSSLDLAQARSTVTLTCKGTLTSRNIAANILVPAGATCLLNDVMITGNVQVQSGASLTVRNANVQGFVSGRAGFRHLDVQGSIVQGEVRAEEGGSFNLNDSQVTGHVRVSRNTGPVRIAHATLNRDLECWSNRAAPTGTWLRVDGRQLGQCSRL